MKNLREILCILTLLLIPAGLAAQTHQDAQSYLAKALADSEKASETLAALRATKDQDLLPFFAALSRSGDKNHRLFATAAMAEIAGERAAPFLLERLRKDPSMVIRGEALVNLISLKAISTEGLLEALSAADENVQCLAARGLAEAGRADLALDALKKLTTSKDLATANIARMSLLAMGYREYLQPLKKVVHDPATPANVVALLLAQIVEEKVAAALVLAEYLAATDSAGPIKVLHVVRLPSLPRTTTPSLIRYARIRIIRHAIVSAGERP